MRPLAHGDPESVGRNQILARIGVGGMAIVYFGRSAGGRAVAVKVMHAEFAADQEYRDRFLREVAAARTAGGRYSPAVLDADPDAPLPWFAMEFLAAVSLREAALLPEDAVWPLAAGLAEALASIHDAGVLHLDVKPGNVLLTEDGPRVIDFGIAGGVRTGAGPHSAGSPGFMSPEQVAGAATGPASDVFSCGATLAYALTGTPRLDSADTELRALIARCLEAEPADRPTVAELMAETATSGPVTLPPAVLADIHQRVAEAENPPVSVPSVPSGPSGPELVEPAVRRRTVLLAGIAAAVAGGAVTAWVLARDEQVPGTARPGATTLPATTTTTVPLTPITDAGNRTAEFIVSGNATVYSLTITVNGQAETVTNVALPWRWVVEVPPWPQRSSWRIDYHHGPGDFSYQLLVDGSDYGSGGSSSTSQDIRDSHEGTI
jgi:hypothetical protein